jgi:hypothetical protein
MGELIVQKTLFSKSRFIFEQRGTMASFGRNLKRFEKLNFLRIFGEDRTAIHRLDKKIGYRKNIQI